MGWGVWLHFTDGKTKAQGRAAEWLPSLHPPPVPQKSSHRASSLWLKPRGAMRCKAGEPAEQFNWRLCQKHPKAGWLSHKIAEELTRIERHKKFTTYSKSPLSACWSCGAGPFALHWSLFKPIQIMSLCNSFPGVSSTWAHFFCFFIKVRSCLLSSKLRTKVLLWLCLLYWPWKTQCNHSNTKSQHSDSPHHVPGIAMSLASNSWSLKLQ